MSEPLEAKPPPFDEAPAPSELHRRLMEQEDGLAAHDDAPGDFAGTLALAEELHQLGALLEPAPAESGLRWGRFELLRPLGRGGLSEVFLARDDKLGRRVALKRLRPHAALDERTRSWLAVEGQSLARIDHPGVVGVLDLETSSDEPLLVMEYVEGAPLSSVLAHRAGAASDDPHVRAAANVLEPLAARVDLAHKIALALAHCHGLGVLHRDIKPSNVVVDLDFQPRLIDFGLAHLDGGASGAAHAHLTEQLVGTPAYFAPEQIDATRIGADPRSDQFAFGALLYELLSGVQPFARATREATMQAVSRAQCAPLRTVAPDVAAELDWIAQRCLERDPRQRYESMDALARDLDAFLHYRAVSVAPPSLIKQISRALRRNATAVAWLSASVLLAGGSLAAKYVHEARAQSDQRATALAQIRGRLTAFAEPDNFQEALFRLADIAREERARAGGFARLLARSLAGESEQAASALADALLGQLASERDEGRAGLREFSLTRWRGALSALARVRPDDQRVRAELARERIVEPTGGGVEHRLQRWIVGRGGQATRLADTPWVSDPGPGRYRWRAIDRASAALRAERDFDLRVDCEPIVLELAPKVAFGWDAVSVVGEPPAGDANGGEHVDVRLGAKLITWADFEYVLPERDGPAAHWRVCRDAAGRRSAETASERASAVVSHPDAELFAARVGARLPAAREVALALDSGLARALEAPVESEWLCEPGRMVGAVGVFRHGGAAPGLRDFLGSPELCGGSREAQIGFRLARSAR